MLAIFSFITGVAPMLAQITNKITDLQMLKAKAQADTEIRDIDRRIEEAHDRRQVIVAEAASRVGILLNGGMRFAMAVPVTAFLWKWLLWDKVVGSFAHCAQGLDKVNGVLQERCASFVTDPIDQNTWMILLGICGFYFAYDFGSKMLKK
jgi:hypothetical protein